MLNVVAGALGLAVSLITGVVAPDKVAWLKYLGYEAFILWAVAAAISGTFFRSENSKEITESSKEKRLTIGRFLVTMSMPVMVMSLLVWRIFLS